MLKYIRAKLFLYMLMGVALFAVLIYLSNTFFIENYYLEQKKKTLLDSCAVIEPLVPVNSDSFDTQSEEQGKILQTAMAESEQSVTIQYPDGVSYYPITFHISSTYINAAASEPDDSADTQITTRITASSGSKQSTVAADPIPEIVEDSSFIRVEKKPPSDASMDPTNSEPDIDPINIDSDSVNFNVLTTESAKRTILPGGTEKAYFSIQNQSDAYQTLRYTKVLDDGATILLSMPMNIISEGVRITNTFTTIIGIIVILLTAIWAFYISGKFTKPIKKVNTITQKMCELDFSQTIAVNGNDEIAALSANINNLSNHLDYTIKELNEKNQKLKLDIDKEHKIDIMRKSFIANVSHELKTPIFLIQGYAEGLKDNLINDYEKKDFYCSVISEEADKMSTLVSDLLALSKAEAEETALCTTCFDLCCFINDIADRYRYTFEQKGIIFDLHHTGPCLVNADAEKLEQVVTNLINNAIDHIDGQKKIMISIENETKNEIENKDGEIKVNIFNTGAPISNESIDKIWDSFYKADESHTRHIGGAGLGLSIVKANLNAHNKEYGIKNEDDGVVFWFCLESASECVVA